MKNLDKFEDDDNAEGIFKKRKLDVNLIIDADLTNPRSFQPRDITLYSKVYLDLDVLLECESVTKTFILLVKKSWSFDVDDFVGAG